MQCVMMRVTYSIISNLMSREINNNFIIIRGVQSMIKIENNARTKIRFRTSIIQA